MAPQDRERAIRLVRTAGRRQYRGCTLVLRARRQYQTSPGRNALPGTFDAQEIEHIPEYAEIILFERASGLYRLQNLPKLCCYTAIGLAAILSVSAKVKPSNHTQ